MGGGAMRAGLAAKYVGLAALRSPVSFSEHGVGRHVAVSGVLSPPVHSSSSACAGADGAAVACPRPVWDYDDSWEFAGDEHLIRDPPPTPAMPAAVFGPVPSLAEATAATCDLKDAFEQICSCGSQFSLSGQGTEDSITKPCVSSQRGATVACIPKQVVNAFSVLKENTQAQSIIAALASDQNVWEAVMKNEKVIEYYLLHSNDSTESVTGSNDDYWNTPAADQPESVITGLVRNLKLKVVKVVSDISEYLHDMIGETEEESSLAVSRDNSSGSFGKIAGTTFMALTILTIMVVLFKRS